MNFSSPWWQAACQILATIMVSAIVWTKLHEDKGSPRRPWRSIATVIAAVAGIALPTWSAINTQLKDQRAAADRAAMIRQLGEANRLARKAAAEHGKPLDISVAAQSRLAAALAGKPLPIGNVEVLCLPGGEANERACDELGDVVKRAGWSASVMPNVTLFGGGGSGGIRVLYTPPNKALAAELAEAMRREGLDARSELAEAGDKRPIAIIVNHV